MKNRYFIVFYIGWNDVQEFNGYFQIKTDGEFLNGMECKEKAEKEIKGNNVRAVITGFNELTEKDFNDWNK